MTTSRNNTIMSWMAYTDFLSRLRIAAGILLPLNTRTLLLYPGERDRIGAAGVDAYLYGMLKAPNGAKQGSAPKLQKKEKDYGTYQSGDGRGRRYAG